MSKNNFIKIEIKPKICINVFGLTDPSPISDQKIENSMEFLLICDEIKSQYVYIKDFDKFIINKTKNKIKKIFL